MQNGYLEEIVKNKSILTPPLNTSLTAKKLIEVLEGDIQVPVPIKSLPEITHEWQFLLSDLTSKVAVPSYKFDTPFVSVCITHFNRPEQLMEVLNGFDKQEYKNFEVLVMDDGSRPEIINKLRQEVEPFMKERKWQIFYQENQFISSARNSLVNFAKGPLILLFEDDDIPFTDTIERFVHIKQKTNADIVNSNGGVARKNKYKISELWLAAGSHIASINGKNQMGSSAVALMEKTTFQKISGYLDLYGFVYSDMEFYIRAALNNLKIVTSIEPTYIYNFVGPDHWVYEGNNNNTYYTRLVLSAYTNGLPKDFRNIPFRIYSLEKELEEQKKYLTYEIPLWKIIYFRLIKIYHQINFKVIY